MWSPNQRTHVDHRFWKWNSHFCSSHIVSIPLFRKSDWIYLRPLPFIFYVINFFLLLPCPTSKYDKATGLNHSIFSSEKISFLLLRKSHLFSWFSSTSMLVSPKFYFLLVIWCLSAYVSIFPLAISIGISQNSATHFPCFPHFRKWLLFWPSYPYSKPKNHLSYISLNPDQSKSHAF